MARHRTFTTGPPPTRDQYVTFDIAGKYQEDPEKDWSESFTVLPLAPAGVLDDLAVAMGHGPDGARRFNTAACLAFLRGVLVPEDIERFDALTHDRDRIVGLIELVQIVGWLSDELVMRPTRPSSDSTPGGNTEAVEVLTGAAALV